VKKIPNPDYIPSKEEKAKWEKEVSSYKKVAPSVATIKIEKKIFQGIKYETFDSSKVSIADTEKGKANYRTLSYANRMMLIYTDIFEFAKKQNKMEMMNYFKERKLNMAHSEISKLGFIPVVKFSELVDQLKRSFPMEDLVDVNVLNDSEHSKPYSFKLHYIEKGGVIVYPSFHKYKTNLVTGFMFRPTAPKQWMIDSHMKEIQMSSNDIFETLPYGLTSEFITATNAIKCVVEGGPDAHCCPEVINGKKLLFVATPGVGGIKEAHFGLLKGQTLRLMFDPDNAGQIGMYGSRSIKVGLLEEHKFPRNKKGLQEFNALKSKLDADKTEYYELESDGVIQKCIKAGVNVEVCSWDKDYGDINDVKRQVESKTAPFKTMEEFLTKFVSTKRINSCK
jgi:hypothetical protein